MKNLKLSLLIAGFVTVLASFLFVACEKKSSTDGDSSSYSIVGTWEKVSGGYYDDYYDTKEVIRLNADNTGTVTITEDGYQTVYTLKYNYDNTTCTGDFLMSYSYYGQSYSYPMEVKIKWYGENTMTVYVRDPEYSYYDDAWGLMGTYERQ